MTAPNTDSTLKAPAEGGRYFNSGTGPNLHIVDIGHDSHVALVDPKTAFWSLVEKDKVAETMTGAPFIAAYREKAGQFADEMRMLMFGLKPSAVYFNPTERCNLNCTYCYIPEEMRKTGKHMAEGELLDALERLKRYFKTVVPDGRLPQVIFHGAEVMLVRDAMFRGIEKYKDDFRFGIQTNATLLDDSAIDFLKTMDVSIGLSLDGHTPQIADKTRTDWAGKGIFDKVTGVMDKLRGYPGFNVISTVTTENMSHLTQMVDFLHEREVPSCMLNMLRCTLPGSRRIKPDDLTVAGHFIAALDRTNELYRKTGRKLVVVNFANILITILAPTARRLLCDISPCGGGRGFFALAPDGGLFPCSEFIGLPQFNGGNLFEDGVEAALDSKPFRMVTERNAEDFEPCRSCAIRPFCGSPCPAEAHEMNGGMDKTGAFCEFYEEQVRYALRLIADGRENDFLWDGWDRDTTITFETPSPRGFPALFGE